MEVTLLTYFPPARETVVTVFSVMLSFNWKDEYDKLLAFVAAAVILVVVALLVVLLLVRRCCRSDGGRLQRRRQQQVRDFDTLEDLLLEVEERETGRVEGDSMEASIDSFFPNVLQDKKKRNRRRSSSSNQDSSSPEQTDPLVS